MHKGEDFDCKVLSVMMRHLNILKDVSFGLELVMFSWEFTDSDN